MFVSIIPFQIVIKGTLTFKYQIPLQVTLSLFQVTLAPPIVLGIPILFIEETLRLFNAFALNLTIKSMYLQDSFAIT